MVGATGSVLHALAARLQQLERQVLTITGRCKEITVHFKSLLAIDEAVSTFIDTQFAAMRDLYIVANIVTVRATTEDLSGNLALQHLQNINVGNCLLGAPTADHNELFRNRNSAGATDIVVYIVSTLIGGAGNFVGCATHPDGEPGAVVANGAAKWVCAHEVGHVLGLQHVTSSDSLMFPSTAWTNTPPDLAASEIRTMTGSDLTQFF